MWEKKEATGAVGYVMLFTIAIIMVIITFFMLASAKLMTIQHDVDDALADSVLASLVADDIYYFETWEGDCSYKVPGSGRELSVVPGLHEGCHRIESGILWEYTVSGVYLL